MTTMTEPVRRHAQIRIAFRETFTGEAGLSAAYERPRSAPNLQGMPGHLADQLQAAWCEHAACGLYVVRSHGIAIAWTCVRHDHETLTVPRHTYPRQITARHQALARKA